MNIHTQKTLILGHKKNNAEDEKFEFVGRCFEDAGEALRTGNLNGCVEHLDNACYWRSYNEK